LKKKGFGGGVLRAIGAQLYGKLNICNEFMNELIIFINFTFNILLLGSLFVFVTFYMIGIPLGKS